MMRMCSILFGIFASTLALSAASPDYALVAYYYSDMKNVNLAELEIAPGALGFESAQAVLGFDVDFNGDGKPDHVIRGSVDYCGTGGCSLWVIDGATKKLIAALFGRPLIVHTARINSWPVLSTYSHSSANSGSFSTYVYDGQRYQQISSVMLYDQAVSELFELLSSVASIGESR
jgi:hypothetical protein